MAQSNQVTWVFWLHASNASRFQHSYRSIAAQVGLASHDDKEADLLSLVFEWLRGDECGNWILIVDNADDANLFHPSSSALVSAGPLGEGEDPSNRTFLASKYLPQSSNGKILVTSRNKAAALAIVGEIEAVLPIEAPVPDEVVELMKKKMPHDKSTLEEFKELAETLEYIPLAVTQACGHINANGGLSGAMSVKRYLALFKENADKQAQLLMKDTGDWRRDPDVPNSVITSWWISFKHIENIHPEAASLLYLMSMFDRQSISRTLLENFSFKNFALDECLGVLTAFSLVTFQNGLQDKENYGMHRLVQLSVTSWLAQAGEISEWRGQAISLLSQSFRWDHTKPETQTRKDFEICEELIPHVMLSLSRHVEGSDWRKAQGYLRLHLASYLMHQGEYGEAEKQITAASEMQDLWTSVDSMRMFRLLEVTILQFHGRFSAAEALSREVWDLMVKDHGAMHDYSIRALHCLAGCLTRQKKYSEAKEKISEVVRAREVTLGLRNIQTLDAMEELGRVLMGQGDLGAAAEMYSFGLEALTQTMGPSALRTLRLQSRIALLYIHQGENVKAAELLVSILDVRENLLGMSHSATMETLENLAFALDGQRKYAEVEVRMRRGLAWYQTDQASQVPVLFRYLFMLALSLTHQKKHVEADDIWLQLLKSPTYDFGVFVEELISMGDSMLEKGSLAIAEHECENAVVSLRRLNGPSDPLTLSTLEKLNHTRRAQGRDAYAEDL